MHRMLTLMSAILVIIAFLVFDLRQATAAQPSAQIIAPPPSESDRLTRRITPDPTFSRSLAIPALRMLQPGDILLRRSTLRGCAISEPVPGCRRWAAVYDSAALYIGAPNGTPTVYTSLPTHGVRTLSLQQWLMAGSYHAAYRPIRTTRQRIANIISVYGSAGETAFNRTQTDKQRDTSLASAQLVWQYYHRLGLDLDSNDPVYAYWLRQRSSALVSDSIAYHAVAPDEIALSPQLRPLFAGRVR